MRIFILPLTSTTRMIIAQRTAAAATAAPRIDDRLAARVHKLWTDWEASPTWWKQRVTTWGRAALDRISYEEATLKSIPRAPPGLFGESLRPPWWRRTWLLRRTEDDPAAAAALLVARQFKIPLVFPPTLVPPGEAAAMVAAYANEKVPEHMNKMAWCAVLAPLTLPFALLPVVPNVPGFYMLYRIWSHWKAWEGAKLLRRIVSEDKFSLEPSADLDAIYKRTALAPTPLLLHDGAVAELARTMGADELTDELHRALAQERARLEKEEAGKEK
ncbi:mitochondrial K+-H+ exchange-related-domain-containing protein [Limtongia smithiae]|uniref:mitochondrial K+-H+ exchange-related-domain-containing protein n=1 Tax=Limtongia smithiae TaxID=1125753 RepID=UPI0034CE95C1